MKISSVILVLMGVLLTSSPLVAQYAMGIPRVYDAAYDRLERKAPLTRGLGTLAPASFSLKSYAPYPGDQNSYGTCTAWATAYAARTIKEAVEKSWTDRNQITSNAYDAGFQFRATSNSDADCNGAQTSECVRSLQQVGAVPQKALSVKTGDAFLCPASDIVAQYRSTATGNRIESYATLFEQSSTDAETKISRVKKSISERNPVVISMICPQSFFKPSTDGLWAPASGETPDGVYTFKHGRHAMCVVGYDDAKFGGAFEVQNSWGTSWGSAGYVWIRYADFGAYVYQAFELITIGAPTPPPAPAPTPTPTPTPAPTPPIALFGGGMRFYDLDDKKDLEVALAPATRNWSVVHASVSGDAQTYQVVPSLLSGSQMRVFVTNSEPAYVYVLGTGSADRAVATLFPQEGYSAALSYSENEIALPSESGYFQMDNTSGTDYLILLYSKDPLAIEDIRQRVEAASGSVGQRVNTVLGNRLLPGSQMKFEQQQVKFQVPGTGNTDKIMAMIVSFKHISR